MTQEFSLGPCPAEEDAVAVGTDDYTVKGEKLWVITEADRSSTTVLTPGEY